MLDTAESWRDRELVQAVLDHAAWGGGIVGFGPTLTALTQGKVLVLVVDAAVLDEMPTLPLLARRHAAHLARVEGAPANGLRGHGGMGAILRSAVELIAAPSTDQESVPA